MKISILNFPILLWSRVSVSDVIKASAIVGVLAVFLVSIFLRFHELDHIPGVNGDEALVAVQVADLVAGRPVVLKMPTGRLLSPVYAVLLMGVQTIFSVDFYTLRSPAFFSGCLLIILSFFLFKRLFGFRVGVFSFLLIASHPVLIAYSRLGIEQCIIPLTTLILVYFAFSGHALGTILSFIVAILVHPVNIFLIPVILIPFSVKILGDSSTSRIVKRRIVLTIVVLFTVGILFEGLFLPEKYRGLLGFPALFDKFVHWPNFSHFVEYIFLLFTGLMAYMQFSGGIPESLQIFWQSMMAVLCLSIFVLGIILLIRCKDWHRLSVVIGTLVSILGFYLITGAEAVHPGVSRYTLWMLVPFLLSISILIDKILAAHSITGAATWILLLFSLLNLIGFQHFYLKQIRDENTQAHQSYRTGEIEPKQLAWEWIRRDAQNKRIAEPIIMAEDWWTYWPLRYLAVNTPNVKVLRMDEIKMGIPELKKVAFNGAYFVGFPEGIQSLLLEKLFGEKELLTHPISGFGEQRVLNIVQVRPNG